MPGKAGKKKVSAPAAEPLREYRRKRDFSKTAEPSGAAARSSNQSHKKLHFVIQKHAASHLHYDFRLELDGVMKSWAVPKGPSVDPSTKRLAMEVEDHPIQYNTFEGTIPRGEYGGGTVMLWDRGTYTADEAGPGDDIEKVLRREYRAGKMSVTLHGERLQGSWALVRTDPGPKPKWLLIKHRDAYAGKYEATEEFMTSVTTDRTMEEIAGGSRVWHSNRGASSGRKHAPTPAKAKASPVIAPMRPQSVRKLPDDERAFLPWHGGGRVLVYATADACALVDASGRDRSSEHPDIAGALAALAKRARSSFVLDGEVVDDATFSVIDALFIGDESLVQSSWTERRARLEALFQRRRVTGVRVAPLLDDGDVGLDAAAEEGWSGILAIDPSSAYSPGRRSRDWLVVSAAVTGRAGMPDTD